MRKIILAKMVFWGLMCFSQPKEINLPNALLIGCDTIHLQNNEFRIFGEISRALKNPRKILHLDFDTMRWCTLNTLEFDLYTEKRGYEEIRCKFRKHSLSIFITIKWKEYEFKFDPAYSGPFMMEHIEKIPFRTENHEIEKNENVLPGEVILFKNLSFYFNGIGYASKIRVSKSAESKVGVGFIKGFNWIIDWNGRKVYVKKNTRSLD